MKLAVIKRDGRRSLFDGNRIIDAVSKAFTASAVEPDDHPIQILNAIKAKLTSLNEITIHQLQQLVEDQLMHLADKSVARHYIEYRFERDLAREKNSQLIQEIEGLIDQSNLTVINENANKDGKVIPTQRDLLAGIVAKHYARNHLLPKHIVNAHDAGELHYHDLDYSPFFPMFNCMLIDLKGMLSGGFKMGNAEIETPKSIATATAVTAQIIAQVASHIYGGTTINRIDEVLAPYVTLSHDKHLATAQEWDIPNAEQYAKKMTEKECLDAFQSLEYEVNTLHTANGQTPFVTFGFGLGDSWQARLIQQSIFKIRIAGLGKNAKTAVFPKLVFAIKEGLNRQPQDPNYDIKQLALECASVRMYPDILNYDKVVEVTGSFKTPMGCRSFLGTYEEAGELIHEGRNNIGVVSLNLPRIAIEAKNDEQAFYKILDQRLSVAKDALMSRIERLNNVKAKVAPILYMEGACGVRLGPEDPVSEIFKNGRASISLGYIGVHETINALYGSDKHLFDDAKRQQKAIAIVKYLKQQTEQWKAETGYGFSLYATPSENLCSRFCTLDTKTFGAIEGVTDKGYYTNSFHLDVEKQANPYDKIDFEMPYPAISNGGYICYGEYPNMQHNLEALENVWDYSYDRVPYYGTNTPIDECYQCGYTGEFETTSKGFCCPGCGNNDSASVSVTRRVCGYLGSPEARPFNFGKQVEVQRRVKHL
ncbi:anaerobic ribonucleoside-triphosphate reductase [Paraferrimonas sp. SM1919]|uniref:anaerobic ribonucleoside-triphosphate reductase n=1 Tax=Paraferrimonas sp. SM1919 TaxID=2662263 RepID=UPI0013D1C5D5|nr:anaerobic ribonucleoside-triphosphate reductase [Paraferrimonas sp. SM1919]